MLPGLVAILHVGLDEVRALAKALRQAQRPAEHKVPCALDLRAEDRQVQATGHLVWPARRCRQLKERRG